MKLIAVVVTYERHATLERCLQHLADQTRRPDLVVVANNGGPLPDALFPAGLEVEVLHTGANLGPGGGFHRGMQLAMQREADWLWLMDDDIEPAPTCAERLLAGAPQGEALLWPAVTTPYEETAHDTVVPGWWGVMVPAATVCRFGYPREDYGWWSEDTEYLSWRLKRFGGVPAVRLEDAQVFHNHRDRQGATPGWKLYYQVRNATHMRLWLRQPGGPTLASTAGRLGRLVGSQVQRALVSVPEGESRRKRLRIVARGFADGVTGNLGLQVRLGDKDVCGR